MNILAIDTANEFASVAILNDTNVIDCITSSSTNTHSVTLMPMIDKILKKNNYNLNDFDLFVCDKGPGSFTGIRIGISTVKAFSDVTGKPALRC